MPLTAPPAPPAQVAPVAPAPAPEAPLQALLEAFDFERPLPAAPRLKGKAAHSYAWARACATFIPGNGLPANPFPSGPPRHEAEGLRSLLDLPVERVAAALAVLPLSEPGTAVALWRWGRREIRAGRWPEDLRLAWEDRLLGSNLPLVRGYAFRHALCWALARGDEARFGALRGRAPKEGTELLPGLQRLFGLLGGPAPVLRLWTLPGLDYRDLPLDRLGAPRIWVAPADPGASLPAIPLGTAWIIPSDTGLLDDREASLAAPLAREGQALAQRLQSAGRQAWFAPSRGAFESLGLDWFPILLEVDAQGRLARVRMGDAAPAQP